jgi:rare lipoprotein A (peptidoglycan hydrolase)
MRRSTLAALAVLFILAPVTTAGGWLHDPEVSFYGPGLYGHRTACGEALTEQLVGVAHRTLPCGTLVEFRWNDIVIQAPVVDRGPYVAGRQWDLTGGACVALGHCFTGPIDWRIIGGSEPPQLTPPPTDTSTGQVLWSNNDPRSRTRCLPN